MRKKRGLFGVFAVLALSVTVLAVVWRYGKRQDAGRNGAGEDGNGGSANGGDKVAGQ